MTLNGIIHLTRLFITKKMKYVLTNEFLSDRIEAEFGIWRQILSSLSFQRLKLFHKLQCESSSKHEGENCCLEELSEEDWDNVATCFQRTSSLSDNEKSTLYYISGYVAKKDNIIVEDDLFSDSETPESEFLYLVSRGKLTQPREDLFDLSMYLYCYYKSAEKNCVKRLVKGFTEIYNLTGFDFEGKQSKVLQRFANTFSNGFRKQQTENIKLEKFQKSLLKRKRMER